MRFLLPSLLIILFFTSCEPRLENNVRAKLSARIITENEVPISGVEVIAYNENFLDLNPFSQVKFSEPVQDFLLGTGITDENGEVSYVMLLNNNSGTKITLRVEGYAPTLLDIADSNYNEDLEYDLEEIILKKRSEVKVEFVNTSGTSDSFNVDISYDSSFCTQFNEEGISEEFDCRLFFGGFRVDADEMINELELFNAVFPGSLLIRYIDVQGNPVEQTFVINNPNENYVINY